MQSKLTPSFDTDALIVGAGPTGLALAIKLRQMGLDPILVERMETGQNTSRAAVIHAHTLDVLDNIGVARAMQRDGMVLSTFSVHERDTRLATLSFDDLPTGHPGLLMIPQDRTEAILRRAYADCGGLIRWRHTVEALVPEAGGVRVFMNVAGVSRSVLARYVVGADGMHSTVRQAAGIGFSGSSYEHSFVLADVEMEWAPGNREVTLFFSPEGPLVVAPLPGHQYRVVAMLANAFATPALEDIQHILQTRGPANTQTRVTRVEWSSRFRLHHRVADAYRTGPYLLMGDAAHVHSPAGGQGMNTGLVDAIVLGQLLGDVLRGDAPASALEQYETLRRPAAQSVLRLAGRLTTAATLRGPGSRWIRNMIFRAIGSIGPIREKLQLNLSGIARERATVPFTQWSAPSMAATQPHASEPLPEPQPSAD